jgi:integrase
MWVEKHGPGWRIRDLVAGRKVTLDSGYPTKTAAKNAKAELEAAKLRGQALRPGGGRVLLAEWVAVWEPAWKASLKPSSAKSEPGRLRNHILPLLGNVALADVDELAVQTWVARLLAGDGPPVGRGARKPLAPKSVHNAHGVLYAILQAAVRQKLIPANPCLDTSLPRRGHHEMRFLTEPEIGRLLAAVPAHWRPLVLLLVSTGLRWGEATALRVADVDILAKVANLRVLRAVTERPGGELVYHPPKTERSRRTVTFTRLVAETLAPLVSVRERDALVFTSPAGEAVTQAYFWRIWDRARRAAGLEDVRVHDLRHTHAAILISAGRPLTAIQHRLGHSSIAVTSDLYGHLMPAVDEGILAAIDEALATITPAMLAAEIDAELDPDGGVVGETISDQRVATSRHAY